MSKLVESIFIIAVDVLYLNQEFELYQQNLLLIQRCCKKFVNLCAQDSSNMLISLVQLGNQPKHLIQINRLDLIQWYHSLDTLSLVEPRDANALSKSTFDLLSAVFSAHQRFPRPAVWTLVLLTTQNPTFLTDEAQYKMLKELDAAEINTSIVVLEHTPFRLGDDDGDFKNGLKSTSGSDIVQLDARSGLRALCDELMHCKLLKFSDRIEAKLYAFFKKLVHGMYEEPLYQDEFLLRLSEDIEIRCRITSPFLRMPRPSLFCSPRSTFTNRVFKKLRPIDRNTHATSNRGAGCNKIEVLHRAKSSEFSDLLVTGAHFMVTWSTGERASWKEFKKNQTLLKALCRRLQEKGEALIVRSSRRLECNEISPSTGLNFYYILCPDHDRSTFNLYARPIATNDDIVEEFFQCSRVEATDLSGCVERALIDCAIDRIPLNEYNPLAAETNYHEFVVRMLSYGTVSERTLNLKKTRSDCAQVPAKSIVKKKTAVDADWTYDCAI